MWAGYYDGLNALPARKPQGFASPRYLAGHAHGAIARRDVLNHHLSQGDCDMDKEIPLLMTETLSRAPAYLGRLLAYRPPFRLPNSARQRGLR